MATIVKRNVLEMTVMVLCLEVVDSKLFLGFVLMSLSVHSVKAARQPDRGENLRFDSTRL